jgi:hypothetical protein
VLVSGALNAARNGSRRPATDHQTQVVPFEVEYATKKGRRARSYLSGTGFPQPFKIKVWPLTTRLSHMDRLPLLSAASIGSVAYDMRHFRRDHSIQPEDQTSRRRCHKRGNRVHERVRA